MKVSWTVDRIKAAGQIVVTVSLETEAPINLIGETMVYRASAEASTVPMALDKATRQAWEKVPEKYKK